MTAAGVPVPLWAPCAAAQERTLEVPPALTARAAAGLRSPAAVGGGGVRCGGGSGESKEEGERWWGELRKLKERVFLCSSFLLSFALSFALSSSSYLKASRQGG